MEGRFVCPFCFQQDALPVSVIESRRRFYSCDRCNARIPSEYVDGDSREVVAVIGLRGHGKSTYLASVFRSLNRLSDLWNGFYSFAVDERSLDTVRAAVCMLKEGSLPQATPLNPPAPTFISLRHMPLWGSRLLLFYDVGGDAFLRANSVVRHAGFVAWARTVILLLSPDELEGDFSSVNDLLSTYVQAAQELGCQTGGQNLVITLSKADRLKTGFLGYESLWKYVSKTAGSLGTDLAAYLDGMREISETLRKFLEAHGSAHFFNFARDRFKTVEFSLFSALGADAADSLEVEVTPKRVLDPLIWLLHNSYVSEQEEMTREENHEWLQIFRRRFPKRKRRTPGDNVWYAGVGIAPERTGS